mmetsp:Transcript_10715/g.35614  ORF Transcript_10715/g.35614 Transcript_10715/m.35614 type:complete len:223 (+) Transcript_10715:3485-4153(+)
MGRPGADEHDRIVLEPGRGDDLGRRGGRYGELGGFGSRGSTVQRARNVHPTKRPRSEDPRAGRLCSVGHADQGERGRRHADVHRHSRGGEGLLARAAGHVDGVHAGKVVDQGPERAQEDCQDAVQPRLGRRLRARVPASCRHVHSESQVRSGGGPLQPLFEIQPKLRPRLGDDGQHPGEGGILQRRGGAVRKGVEVGARGFCYRWVQARLQLLEGQALRRGH